jgi:putative phosphoribosyl transferase
MRGIFADRADAGQQLAALLVHLGGDRAVVLGLPRGGVPVAREVAVALGAPLDVIVVRKLGVPAQPELAMGAVGEDGVFVINPEVVRQTGVSAAEVAAVREREQAEVTARAALYRASRAREPLDGRVAVVVDDGIATGATARAACEVARAHGAVRVILAVPVAPPGWVDRLAGAADELVSAHVAQDFTSVGQFYEDFTQTTDEQVNACLLDQAGWAGDVAPAVGQVRLSGYLTVPPNAPGIVLFAHGSGSGRNSPRNRYVAEVLHAAGLGTFLFDLLTPGEALDRANVFDIGLLARRLADVRDWLRAQPLPGVARGVVGYFGASTGAAAALWAAAEPGSGVVAVVSRGGRPDLAGERLAKVTAPTLLIVGGEDHAVLDLNLQAQAMLRCENRLDVVPGATHLFEEPGALTAAATLASDWFTRHLVKSLFGTGPWWLSGGTTGPFWITKTAGPSADAGWGTHQRRRTAVQTCPARKKPAAMTPTKKPSGQLVWYDAAMPIQTVASAMPMASAMACPGRLVNDRAAAAGPIISANMSSAPTTGTVMLVASAITIRKHNSIRRVLTPRASATSGSADASSSGRYSSAITATLTAPSAAIGSSTLDPIPNTSPNSSE